MKLDESVDDVNDYGNQHCILSKNGHISKVWSVKDKSVSIQISCKPHLFYVKMMKTESDMIEDHDWGQV